LRLERDYSFLHIPIFPDKDEYMAFGLSGSETSSRMEGADVAIAYMDDTRGYATDYNITAKAPVSKVIFNLLSP